jgi:peroxiredoxin
MFARQKYRKASRPERRSWGAIWNAAWLICFVFLSVAGCSPSKSDDTPTTPREVLQRTADTYRRAGSYADSGELRLRYVLNDKPEENVVDFSVTLVRLNKLRMHYYNAIVVCDGKDFRATIAELPGKQVLSLPAPKRLTPQNIYETDLTLGSKLTSGIGGASLPLDLMLSDDALQKLLADQQGLELLSPEKCENDLCYRVQIKKPTGILVFWIDQKTYVVRRIEYPSEAVRMAIGAGSDNTMTHLSLTAEFYGATLNHKVDEVAFQFEIPADARVVQKFDAPYVPLPPEPPSSLLGKKIGDFSFTSLDGKPVTSASLQGQIVVLDFWVEGDGQARSQCLEQLSHLEEVFQKYKSQKNITFLAVNLDSPQVGIKRLTETFLKARLSLPIVRDLPQKSLETFSMKNIPNLYVLGPDGTVEDHQLGNQPKLASDLSATLDLLLKGESAIKLANDRFDQQRREYDQAVAKLSADAVEPQPINKAKIAPASEPSSLSITKLWACDQLVPGNIMVIPAGGDAPPRILVFDGLQSISELSTEGKVSKKHDLDIPKGVDAAVVSYLRTAVDMSGTRYFAASGPSQQQMYLFDDQFQKLLSFPAEGKHAGISDVQLADLDGDGEPEINIGYWGQVGVHNVSLKGVRRWSNRSIEEVLGLAVSAADPQKHRRLLVTQNRGSIVPINYEGREDADILVPERFIRQVIAADLDGDQQPELCALALGLLPQADLSQKEMVIGLGRTGEAVWSFDLPPGTQHHAALEMVASGNLLGGEFGQWVIAAADGTIHIIGIDGASVDHFAYGSALTGIAVAQWDGQRVLLLATTKGVEAWKVEKKATSP